MPPLTCHTCKLDATQSARLRELLNDRGYFFGVAPPYAAFSAEKEKVKVVLYESGKLVIQGKGTPEFVEFILEPEVLQTARVGYEEVLDPDLLLPRLGVDESGKGDFFGPLCIAGVYVNAGIVRAWKESGIRDSKSIGSDRKMAELAKCIRETPGCIFSVVPIGNEAYNRLYKTLRSVNAILAWGHARVIENLMLQRHRMDPPPVRAISDQFAASKDVVGKALMGLGREIELVQRHKAESDLAVAAASILARDEFVSRLDKLGRQLGRTLPKGASAAVDKVAKDLVDERGSDFLKTLAKVHFRTANRAAGLPEPPKKEWRKPPKAPEG